MLLSNDNWIDDRMKESLSTIRDAIDAQRPVLLPVKQVQTPPLGWIATVRSALGMSQQVLANRLKVAKQRVSRLEAREITGETTLAQMREAADALGCDFVYVFVPRVPLQEFVTRRAEGLARRELAAVERTMQLEDQETPITDQRVQACFQPDFLTELHTRMFGEVWTWAGQYRLHDVNIGNTEPHQIEVAVHQVFDDARAWIEYKSFELAEIAIRLHHRLVLIHPFVNGNGRSTRLMADVAAKRLGLRPFTWGADSLAETGEARAAYVAALQAADNHDLGPLLAFAQS
ncbi:MAG: hypothetical protein B7Z29_07925 [Hyphomicrobium sp. 12-62-95]|nr:MAG: hypothetical protein B7Z29_07925 [Hyphomicrobium sp. 12-62-95]